MAVIHPPLPVPTPTPISSPPPTPVEVATPTPLPITVTPTAENLLESLNEQAIRINELQKELNLAHRALVEINENNKAQADRMATIEQAILDDPEKALKVFVLQRDVQELVRDIESVKGTIEQLFTITMTLFGGLLISIAGLVISNFLQQRRESSSQITPPPPQPPAISTTTPHTLQVQQHEDTVG
jgi:hypothetical protein